MNINQWVIEQLEQLVTKGPENTEAVLLDSTQQQGYIIGLTAEAEGVNVSLNLVDYDRYSVASRNLKVSYKNPAKNGDKDYLRQCAEQLVRRVTYLEEPLELLEVDAEAGLAQLRSRSLRQEDNEKVYWEAMIQAEPYPTVSLTRYRWTPDISPEREVVVYPVTFATLGRIIQDLAESQKEMA
jgi:hypothetical protein